MTPNDFFVNVIDPNDPAGQKVQAIIPHRLILRYYRFSPVRYENFRAAKDVLENPQRIFSGVRQFNEGGWCFTGRPKSWYIKEQVQAPFPEKLIFAVYLNSRLYVYEARAEPSATDDGLCPQDWKSRYGALIWKSIS
jgi:hypothetical protein